MTGFDRAQSAFDNGTPPSDEIGPCFHCPGECSVEDHWEDVDEDERGCERHPECPGYLEYTHEQYIEDMTLERAGL